MTDSTGRIFLTNSAFRKMLGFTKSELHKRTFLEITHEEDRTANQELVRGLVEGARPSFQIEKCYCRKDGTLVWVRNNVVRVSGIEAEGPFWFGIIEDITHHNRLHDERRSPNTPEMMWTAVTDSFDCISELSQEIGAVSKESIKSTLNEWTKGNNSLRSLFSGLPPLSLRDSRDNVVRFVGSYAYIEPLKRAQQSLKESETRLQAFFENSPNLVFLKDREGRYLQVNKEFKRALRITEEQIRGKRDDEIFSLEQAASFHTNDRQVLDAGVPMEFEEVTCQEDGPHTSIVHKFPLLNAEGEIYAIGGIATDITERKRAEKELLALRDELAAELTAMTRLHEFSTHVLTIDELQSLIEEVLDATITSQSADFGNIQIYNHEAQALETVAQRGFQQDFLEHFTCVSDNGTSCGRAVKLRQRVIIEDVDTDSEFAPHRHIAESAGFRAVQSTPLLSRSRELLGMLSTHFRRPHRPSVRDLRFTDLYARHLEEVLERKQAQQALQMTQVELARVSRLTTMGELAASIAHEVNQPLAAVTNNSSACLRLLASGNLKPEVLRRSLEEMVADCTRASAVIARIRAFIQKAPGERNLVDMNEIIQEAIGLTARELYENRIQIDRQLTKPIPRVSGDRVQLQQILLNLIMNSIEAMVAVTNRPRSLVVQSGVYESGNVLIAVRDSGTGIGSDADRVFTPFFTTKEHGMGMGLSISRSLIEAHGGRLWAEPNSPYGTVFYFILPVGARTPS